MFSLGYGTGVMVSSAATTIAEYLASLPEDRRAAISRVRDIVNEHLPAGFEEGMQYGMLSWYIPLAKFPNTYNGQPLAVASLGSQKNYMALYLMGAYADPALDAWFRAEFAAAGKKLDMGKSCVRFKTVDALALDVIGETIAKCTVNKVLENYERAKPGTAVVAAPAKPAKLPAKKPAKPAASAAAIAVSAKRKLSAKPAASARAKPAKPAKPDAKRSR